ncbi:MAG: MerR family transcriptional regulator [Thermoleophilaceae bacterium]
MTASVARDELRIGDVAKLVGTTPRTIRYYEEIGLLPTTAARMRGAHRLYTQADVERLREVMQLKELLGVSLEELKTLVEAEDARAALRAEWQGDPGRARRSEILTESLGHLDGQLALLRRRRKAIEELEAELVARRRRVQKRLRELLVASS